MKDRKAGMGNTQYTALVVLKENLLQSLVT